MTHSQIEFIWNRTDDEQSSWYTERTCSVPVRAVLVLESRIGCNDFRITSTLNQELFLLDTSNLRTDELMILRLRDSANSDCLQWLTQHIWTKIVILENWFCANAMARVNRGPEWGRNVQLAVITNKSQWRERVPSFFISYPKVN